jgi:hypothetical protein
MSAEAVATLVEARMGGFRLTVESGSLRCRPALVPPDLLDRLRSNKAELLELLRGDRCRRCGEPMGWPSPAGVIYGDGTAEHHPCRLQAAAGRAVAGVGATSDEGELVEEGQV